MSLSKRVPFGKSIGVALLICGIWLSWNALKKDSRNSVQKIAQSEKVAEPSSSGTSENSSDPAELSFHPKKDMRYTYAFLRHIAITGLSNSIPEIQYEGKLFIDVLQSDKNGFQASITDELTDQPKSNAAMVAHIDRTGKSLQIYTSHVEGETDIQHLNILKDLLANWVFPLETDTVGSYRAHFGAQSNENGFLTQKKQKLTYNKSNQTIPEILSSTHVLNWALDIGLPYSISGTDNTQLGNSAMSISSQSRYMISFLGEEPSHVDKAQLTKITQNDSLALSTDKGSRPGSRREPNSHQTWATLEGQLSQMGSLAHAEQLQLFGDLLDYFRSHGANLKELSALLSPSVMAAGSASPLFKMAVGVMATLGTPEAQASLVGVYEDPNCPTNGKGTILAALTTTQASATPATREFLMSEAQNQSNLDLSNGALWALGSSINTNDTSSTNADPAIQKGVASIQQAWENAVATSASESQKMAVLDAIGNSGNDSLLPILQNVIADPSDPTLQSKAVFSLRFMSTADAQNLLVTELVNPNPNIRLASAKALSFSPWNAAFANPLQGCATQDQVSEVRSACQTVLTQKQS